MASIVDPPRDSKTRQRRLCPHCSRPTLLKKDGMLRHHTVWRIFPWGGGLDDCPGSGRLPEGGAA